MRMSELGLAFLIAHIVADFHLQPHGMAVDKARSWRALLGHGLLVGLTHALAVAFLSLWQAMGPIALTGLALLLGHVAIDLLKGLCSRGRLGNKPPALYLADQALHMMLILAAAYWLYPLGLGGIPIHSGYREALRWALLVLLVTKPANVSFKLLFSRYQLPSPGEGGAETVPGAGALIGNMERLISALFIALSQYGAIALIYTAKSIARFKQIEQNRRFAEYYLIGTLYSILCLLLAYMLVIVVM